MIKKKEPTKKEVKELLKKAEETAKSKKKEGQEKKETLKIKTKPSPQTSEKKIDLILSKLENFENRLTTDHHRLDRIDNLLSKRDTAEQKKQTKQITSEEKLAQAQAAQEKIAGQQQAGQQPGQTQGQPTPEEAAQAALQFQQEVAQAQAAQKQGQQPGQKTGQALTPQGAWLLERAAHAAEVILPAFFQNKGNNTGGTPLKAFFEQLKVYQAVENTIMSGFFNFMKMLPGNQRQAAMSGIMTSPSVPTMTNLPLKSEFIE